MHAQVQQLLSSSEQLAINILSSGGNPDLQVSNFVLPYDALKWLCLAFAIFNACLVKPLAWPLIAPFGDLSRSTQYETHQYDIHAN